MQKSTQYSDWDQFDVEEYTLRSYGRRILGIDRELIAGAMRAIEGLGIQPGSLRKVADVGTGPNIYPALLLAPLVAPKAQGGHIDLIEYSRPNRQYLQDFIAQREPAALAGIWDKFEDLMASHSEVWQNALARVRALAEVREGDIFTLPHEVYDAVSAYFVTESITDSRETFDQATARLIGSVKPGGLVMVAHMLESTGWHAGLHTAFPATPLTVLDLREIYAEHLESVTIVQSSASGEIREDDHGGALVIGRKKKISKATSSYRAEDVEKIFTSYDTQSCLYDAQRVEYFRQAIFATVKPGDIVVDGGSGTGVLGLLAAQAGAAKVYCVELNPQYVGIIEQNARSSGLADRIVSICGDATKVDLPGYVDVIISEVISAGFFYEPQLQILSNLKRFLKHGGSIIPGTMDNYCELLDAQENLYGLTFNHDTRYRTLPGDIALTTRARYTTTDFYQEASPSIAATARVRALASGRANALRIPYSIRFSDSILATEATEFLLNPQIIFLKQPLQLEFGAYYDISLEYEASTSPLDSKIEVKWAGPTFGKFPPVVPE